MSGKARRRLLAGMLCLVILFADTGSMVMQVSANEVIQGKSAVNDIGNYLNEEKKIAEGFATQVNEEGQNAPVEDGSVAEGQDRPDNAEGATEEDKSEPEIGKNNLDNEDKPADGDSTGNDEKPDEGSDTRDEIDDGEAVPKETEESAEDNIAESEEDDGDTIEDAESGIIYSNDTDIAYAVTGGNIYFDESSGTITDCDDSVTKAVIPSKINGVEVTAIGYCAFKGCSNLENITISSSVKNINDYAFDGCSSLKELVIPEGVESLGGCIIRGTSIKSITIPTTILYSGTATISTTYLGNLCGGALTGGSLKKVVFAEGIKKIPDNICRGDKNGNADRPNYIESVTIPDSVEEIGNYAFYNCTLLGTINLPKTVKIVGRYAFANCQSITKVVTNYNNTSGWEGSLYAHAFSDCTALKQVQLSGSIKTLGSYAFLGCISLEELIIPEGVEWLGGGLIKGTSISSIIIPTTATYSESEVNWDASQATYEGALSSCESLKEVIFAEGIKKIPANICEKAAHVSNIEKVTIPESVEEIGKNAFYKCANLTDIYYQGTEKEWAIISIGNYNDSLFNATIHYNSTVPSIPVGRDIIFTDSPYSVYTDYDVLIMARIANGSNLSESDFTWKSNDENVAKIVSTSSGQMGEATYAFATLRGTGKTLGHGSLTLTLSDGRSGRCALICVGKKTENKQPSYQVTSEPKEGYELLAEYGNQWEKEYNAYIKAVNKSLNKYASSDDGKREVMIADMAKKMQQEDSKSSSKHLSFEATFPSNWSKSNVYNALARYLCDNTSSKMDFGENLKEKNIVKTVLNSLSSSSVPYTYGNIEMNVSMFQFSGSKIGSIVCYDKNKPNKKYTVAVCSTRSECEAVIRDYYDQLASLENAAVYNIYTAVGQDILGEPVSKFTEKWLKQHLGKYVSQLNQTGIGNLYNSLETCNKYYQFIIKISNGDMDAAESLMGTISGLKIDDTTIEDSIVKKAAKNLNTAGEKLIKAYMQYMEGALKDGWLQKTMRVIFSCPVGISVWNEDGEQIGYVGEDDIWYTDAISIEENGEAKIINSYTNEQLKFTISGTDYGILGCSIEEYNIGNEPAGRVNFYDIPLSQDTVFTLDLPEVLSDSLAMDSSDGSKITADEYILAEDNGSVNITCAIESDEENGGTVTGDGTYVRGDAAVLTATPETGFRFIGWYQDDVLWAVSKVYEFTAREDISLKAVFRREKIDYTVTFDLQGHGSISTPYVDIAEDSKIEEEPIPIAEGYTFTGWYKEESCENKWVFEMDTVQEDITLYAGWVEDSVSDEEKYYQVDFDTLSHGIAPEAYTNIKENSTISEPVAPTAAGYRFIGWFKDHECTIPWQFDVDIVTSDLTLYAGWTPEDEFGDILPEDIPESGIIPSGLWIAAIKDHAYTGKPIKPEVHVYDSKTRLQQGRDYTITYKNNVNAKASSAAKKAPTIVVKGKGNYAGTETETFTIQQVNLNASEVVCENLTFAYTSKVQKKIPTISYGGRKLTNNKDFIVSYPDLDRVVTEAYCAPGTYEILLTAKEGGNYTGTRSVGLTITKSSLINKATVDKIPKQPYTGYAIEPDLTVRLHNKILVKDTDYTVAYADNKEIGKATAVLTGIGDYAGTKKVTFNIVGTSLGKAKVHKITDQTYNGSEQKPDITVSLNGSKLQNEIDYKVTYTNNLNVGKATVTITGINAYTGVVKKTFRINAYDLKTDAEYKIDGLQNRIACKYLKNGCTPKIELAFGGTKLTEGIDYTLSYKNNKTVTTSENRNFPTIIIKGKGNFRGTVSKTFAIVRKPLEDSEFPVTLRVADKGFSDKAGNYISKPVLIDTNGKKLVSGKDYDSNVIYMRENGNLLSKTSRLSVGNKVKVKVTGKGAYSGQLEALYEIKIADFSKTKITIVSQPYTGREIVLDQNDVTVKLNGTKLRYGTDYEILPESYRNNLKKGTAEVTIIGKGKYGGMKTVKFRIISKKLEWFWRMLE